jgi:hypothetical protein
MHLSAHHQQSTRSAELIPFILSGVKFGLRCGLTPTFCSSSGEGGGVVSAMVVDVSTAE